jgi:hypothetical protein
LFTYHALLHQEVLVLVDHLGVLGYEMLGRQFEYLVGLVEVLLREHRLVHAVVPDQPDAGVLLVAEGGVDVRLDGAGLVQIQLGLDSENEVAVNRDRTAVRWVNLQVRFLGGRVLRLLLRLRRRWRLRLLRFDWLLLLYLGDGESGTPRHLTSRVLLY